MFTGLFLGYIKTWLLWPTEQSLVTILSAWYRSLETRDCMKQQEYMETISPFYCSSAVHCLHSLPSVSEKLTSALWSFYLLASGLGSCCLLTSALWSFSLLASGPTSCCLLTSGLRSFSLQNNQCKHIITRLGAVQIHSNLYGSPLKTCFLGPQDWHLSMEEQKQDFKTFHSSTLRVFNSSANFFLS